MKANGHFVALLILLALYLTGIPMIGHANAEETKPQHVQALTYQQDNGEVDNEEVQNSQEAEDNGSGGTSAFLLMLGILGVLIVGIVMIARDNPDATDKPT